MQNTSDNMNSTGSLETTPSMSVQEKPRGFQPNPSFIKYYSITEQITMYGTLVIGSLGLFFNILSLIIFVKLKFQKSPTGLHLLLFTISETLMTVGMFMSRPLAWSQHINIPIVAKHHFSFCNILQFMKSSQIVWGSLLLVSATIQRYLAVTFLLAVKSWNLASQTKITISIVTNNQLG